MGGHDTFHHIIAINRAIAAGAREEAFNLIVAAALDEFPRAEAAALLRRANEGWHLLAATAGIRTTGPLTGGTDELPHAAFGRSSDDVVAQVELVEDARPSAALVVYGSGRKSHANGTTPFLNALGDQARIAMSLLLPRPAGNGKREAAQAALDRAEEALATADHERRKLEVVMEAAPAGIILLEAPGMRMAYTNQTAREMCIGLNLARPVMEHAGHFRRPGGRPYTADELPGVRALRHGETIRNEEMTFVSPAGETRVFEVNAAPVRIEYSGVGYAVVALRDITAQKLTESRIQDNRRMLEMRTRHLRRVNQELEQFAYVVSHDLKAPLRAVSNLSTWIEEDIAGSLAPENRKQMKLLRSRVKRMDTLINALLEYSRAGRVSGPVESVDTGLLVREVVNSMSLPRPFVVDIETAMPVIDTDKLHLSQVFANLISNAIKHHDRPEEGRIEIRASDAGRFHEFTVADNGPGIAQAYTRKVFEMFQSLDDNPDHDNTGIGLALIRKLVQNNGGDIRLESGPGRGAAFHFTWPKRLARDE